MFVRNCRVHKDELLSAPATTKYATQRRRGAAISDDEVLEVYKPVSCAECGLQVAVLDSEDVYHFFNVLPSYS